MSDGKNDDAAEEREELSFVEALKRGLADYDDVDDYIDKWHDGPYDCELYEFLGMTQKQFFEYAKQHEPYLRRTFPRKSRA